MGANWTARMLTMAVLVPCLALASGIDVSSVAAQELPPDIEADRFLLEAERQISNGDFAAALAALDRIVVLQAEQDLEVPPASFLPAAAQSGSAAVVCVGSETRTLQTNPIRRVYTEDMEVVYRIGVDIGQRSEVERALSSELGSYPEVWCAWSDPGDDHAVINSYTGVIRQDLTVDPEDPRFQAFSVGFGEDFDEAETRATTISQRFSSQNDGSGYEVLLQENGMVAGDAAPEPNLPEGPICTGSASSDGCWMETSNQPGCYGIGRVRPP